MNRETLIEKLDQLSENQDFADALNNANDTEDIIRILAGYNITATSDDLNDILSSIKASDELSEDSLEDVSGGLIITTSAVAAAAAALGISVAVYRLWKRLKKIR